MTAGSAAIADRLARVSADIAAACERAGRRPDAVTLLAVSKRHPASAVKAARAAGQQVFGESYAQELAAKADALSGTDVRWHFIGKLQRNKVKLVVGRVELIHAVDSERLAVEIDARARAVGVTQDILLAVNVAGEAQKSGIPVSGAPGLLTACSQLPHVAVRGFMTMPPWPEDPEQNRPHFEALRALRDRLQAPDRPLPVLSMGTTGDLAVAVECGATVVRVGTAVFGPRPQTE